MTKVRVATCGCGQLKAECSGEPFRISVCHCLACKQRSGSAFAVQARYPAEDVAIAGTSSQWMRIADSGQAVTFHFCPACGATVWYEGGGFPGALAIPVGAFADPDFPPPRVSVWEERKCGWVAILGEEVEHVD